MDNQKTPTTEPSSQNFCEDARKLLATNDIIPTAKFVAALTNSTENHELCIDLIDFYRFCATNFPVCLSRKLLQVYASREHPLVSDEIREYAIRILYLLLSEEDESFNLIMVHELSPLLISCLGEQGIPDATFKVLCQVVNRVAFDVFTCHEATWHDLREFISSRAETEFEKAVLVFQSLSMALDGDEFVIPLMENLLPAILKRLGDESQWCLAFVGGFCAAIHLLDTTRVDLVANLFYEMLKSVKTGMKLGFLEKALREVETVVVKQLGWYSTAEFRFVVGLIRRINVIIGEITKEEATRTVLQRIFMVVKSKLAEEI